ncbi:MAG: aminotransferase class V-fold PLP-dependent enzyme [Sphingomonas fennica]
MPDRIYLDHAAATPVLPAAAAAMAAAVARWANPSSPHAEGRAARAALEEARRRIGAALGWRHDIVFTSGASEALGIALARPARPRPVLASAVEHAAVFRQAPGASPIPVGPDGCVDPATLAAMLADAPGAIVAIQAANSETGVRQPLADLAVPVAATDGLLLADCSQSAGRLPLPEADLIVVSAHKLGGPPGAGALLVRDPGMLAAIGGQERGYRIGTENLPAILGFAAALEMPAGAGDPAGWRADLEARIGALGGIVVGAAAPRLPQIGAYRLPGIAATTLLIRLDMAGFAISAGSACSSGSLHASPVLTAMGLGAAAAAEVFRVSFGHGTTAAEVDAFAAALAGIVADIRGRA